MSRAAQIRLDVLTREGEAGLERMERQAVETTRSFERLDRETDDLERSQKKLGMTAGQTANALRRSGRSGRAAGRLLQGAAQGGSAMSGTLTTLVPQLGGAAMVLGEAASAAEMFAGAGASVLRVLGPVAVAALAAGAAWKYFADQVKAAEEAQKVAAEAALVRQKRTLGIDAVENANTLQQTKNNRLEAVVDGRMDEERAQVLNRMDELRANEFGDDIREARRAMKLAEAGTDEFTAAVQRLASMEGRVEELAQSEVSAARRADELNEALQKQAQLEAKRLQAGERAAAVLKKEAEAARIAAEQLANLRRETALLAGVAVSDIVALGSSQASASPDSFDSRMALQQASGAHLGGVPLDLDYIEERRERRAGRLVGGAQIASSVMGGDVAGLVGMGGGPGGMAASAAISGLSTLGEKGAAGIIDAIESQAQLLVDGIGELPDLLIAIPEMLGDLLPELLAALIRLPFELVPAIASALWELFKSLPDILTDAIKGALGMDPEEGKRFDVVSNEKGIMSVMDNVSGSSKSGLTSSDAEKARILQAGDSSSERGRMSARSSRSGGQRGGSTHRSSGGTTIINNGPVLSSPLTAWHGDMDARFGDNGWDRKPNYAGGPL